MASIDYADYKTLNPRYGKQTEKFLNEQCPYGVDNCPLRENELFPCLYKYKIIKKKRIRAKVRQAHIRFNDLVLDSECKVEFRFQTIASKMAAIALLFGNRGVGWGFGFFIARGDGSKVLMFPGCTAPPSTSSSTLYKYTFSPDTDYRVTLDKTGFYVNDDLIKAFTPPSEVVTCGSSAWLNVCHDGSGSGVYGYNEHWIYHIKVWRSGELIHSFVAAYSEKLDKFYPPYSSSYPFTDAEP